MASNPNPKPKPSGGISDNSVPKAVVSRLSLYLREIQHLLRSGHATTSSTQLGRRLGLTDAQVRKDFAFFGQFGYPGIGYRCDELVAKIRNILGTDREWPVAIVGLGNLGRALLGHRGFDQQGFKIVAAFDIDPAKVHRSIDNIPVYHVDEAAEVVRRDGIRLVVLAVPGNVAQSVADQMVQAGVEGVLNFAPVALNLREPVRLVAVDLAIELEQLAYSVVNRSATS